MITDLIPIQYRLLAVAGVVAVVAATSGATGWKLNGWRLESQIQTLKTEHAQAVADSEKLATAASETYRREEQRLNSKVKDAENVLSKATASNSRIADGLRADNGRLRRSISDFASGGSPANDTLATCRSDAETLGDVLGDTLQREEVATGAAEANADTARALFNAWPAVK